MKEYEIYKKDDGMLYELLLRKAYKCGRSDDPFSLADADVYFYEGKKQLPLKPTIGLWTSLTLLKKQIGSNNSHYKEVNNMINEIQVKRSKKKCHEILIKALEIMEENNISEFPHVSY